MKKIIYSTIICLCSIISSFAQTYSGGTGTAAAPYLISSKADMAALAMAVNGGTTYSGTYFLLTQNLTGIATRIGNSETNSFRGIFDGGGYVVEVNIAVDGSSKVYAGVFGYISGATIKNLGVAGVVSSSSSYDGSYSYSGGLCGYSTNSTISNCYATGDVSSSSSSSYSSYSYSGGLCGYGGRITNSFAANASLISKRDGYNGAIGRIAAAEATIEICYALSSMLLNDAPVSSQSPTNKEGKDTNLSSFQSQAWIEDNLYWDFNNTWYIPNGLSALPVFKKTTKINFSLSSNTITYGDLQTITLAATSNNSTTPIVYSSTNNDVATIAGNSLTIKKAGTVAIIASQSDGNGFKAGGDTIQLVINKKELTLTANAASMTYGDTPPQYTCQYEGFAFNETQAVLKKLPALSCPATASSNAGNYTITPSAAEADNYSFVYKTGTLTVNKRNLRVIPNNTSWVYGDNNSIYFTFSFSYDGLINGDYISTQPTATTTATRYSNTGVYDITCSGGSATNYNFIYEKGQLTITKAPLNIAARTAYRYYGADNPVFAVSYSGFRNSDTEAVLSSQPQVFCNATKSSDAGNYPITISENLSAANYDISYTNGSLQIYKAILTAKADDKTRYVGEANPNFTITYTGFVNGENELLLDVLPQAICNAQAASAPGAYSIYVTGGSDTNYELERQSGTLTILSGSGIQEVASQWSVYPNPASESCVIQGASGSTLTITNMQGYIAYQKSNIAAHETVDVSTWSKGLYFLTVQAGSGKTNQKLIIR
ncbi:MAG: hypothetical protein EZS26_002268 [Candidatus Ordinivivax streblomastigis]|uniref:Secretion system C-terminal sorting domain-containing protein n=1 Tax=Candidatus Ordinivivax streblomastigis TaxID=2540710 RepID=A0A5M8NZE4_9BACT|nr:MAG: hypothetical protein EZS26_002268 [Candidatus Ordinivivax streblomastigis]